MQVDLNSSISSDKTLVDRLEFTSLEINPKKNEPLNKKDKCPFFVNKTILQYFLFRTESITEQACLESMLDEAMIENEKKSVSFFFLHFLFVLVFRFIIFRSLLKALVV